MEVAVAVAGIIRQQACGLEVWCPEEEEEEEEAPIRTCTNERRRLGLTLCPPFPQSPASPRQGFQHLRQTFSPEPARASLAAFETGLPSHPGLQDLDS